jgi:hypothetical protein
MRQYTASGRQLGSSVASNLAERFRQLEVLFKQGLVTKAEYDHKRNEILAKL